MGINYDPCEATQQCFPTCVGIAGRGQASREASRSGERVPPVVRLSVDEALAEDA